MNFVVSNSSPVILQATDHSIGDLTPLDHPLLEVVEAVVEAQIVMIVNTIDHENLNINREANDLFLVFSTGIIMAEEGCY